MKAKALLNLLDLREILNNPQRQIDELLHELSDDQLRTALLTMAGCFSTLKREAQRRDIWDGLKGHKI